MSSVYPQSAVKNLLFDPVGETITSTLAMQRGHQPTNAVPLRLR